MDPTKLLLDDLKRRGVRVWLEQGQIKFRGPPSQTAALKVTLEKYKVRIVEALTRTPPSAPPDFRKEADVFPVPSYRQFTWDRIKASKIGPDIANRPNVTIRVAEEINVELLECTIRVIINRHSALKLSILERGGRPWLMQNGVGDIRVDQFDVSGLPASEREQAASNAVSSAVWREFKCETDPLFRCFLVKVAGNDTIFGFVLHDFVGDHKSTRILALEICALYRAFKRGQHCKLPKVGLQYSDYLFAMDRWFASSAAQASLNYWKQKLAGAQSLAADQWKAVDSGETTADGNFEFNKAHGSLLKGLSVSQNFALSTLLIAIQVVCLSRLTGLLDITIALKEARMPQAFNNVVGNLASCTYCRIKLNGNPSFLEIAERICAARDEGYGHVFLRFDALQQEFKDAELVLRTPLFEFRSYPKEFGEEDEREERPWTLYEVAPCETISPPEPFIYPYSLILTSRRDGIYGQIRVAKAAIGLVGYLYDVLGRAAFNPGCRISDFHLSPSESDRGVCLKNLCRPAHFSRQS